MCGLAVISYLERKLVNYKDLKSPEFKSINPSGKIPGLVHEDGKTVFEASVILNYLEHKYCGGDHPYTPSDLEERQLMELIIRCHDLYIASPNCNQPGFSHCQGAMYLPPYETEFCSADRAISRQSRAFKIKEIWEQLQWLDNNMAGTVGTPLSSTIVRLISQEMPYPKQISLGSPLLSLWSLCSQGSSIGQIFSTASTTAPYPNSPPGELI